MKIFLSIIFSITLLSFSSAQFKSFGLVTGGGVTVVDVAKVINPNVLTDWNNYSLVFKGFAEYQLKNGTLIGLEAGRNRLYYWQYQAPGNSWYNWRTEWTTNAVLYFLQPIGERFFIKGGAGIHIFYKGTTFGLLAEAGTSFWLSESIRIPLALRVEPVFGTETPIAFNVATGIKFNLK